LKTTSGKGRNAKTGWTTVDLYIAYIIWLKKDLGARFAFGIRALVEEQIDLMEHVAGYEVLLEKLRKLHFEQIINEQLTMSESLTGTG